MKPVYKRALHVVIIRPASAGSRSQGQRVKAMIYYEKEKTRINDDVCQALIKGVPWIESEL